MAKKRRVPAKRWVGWYQIRKNHRCHKNVRGYQIGGGIIITLREGSEQAARWVGWYLLRTHQNRRRKNPRYNKGGGILETLREVKAVGPKGPKGQKKVLKEGSEQAFKVLS